MDALTKTIVVILLALVSSACTTSMSETKRENDNGELVRNVTDEEILQFAHERMKRTVAHLEQKILDCNDNKGMKTVIPPHVLPTLPLSTREWGTALAHLSFKATKNCEGNAAWGDALMALTQFIDIEKQLTGANTTDVSPYTVELLCCIGERGSIETELRYRKIPPEIRQKLESIPELNQPFNPIKTFEAMRR